jgi:hypothetical protein
MKFLKLDMILLKMMFYGYKEIYKEIILIFLQETKVRHQIEMIKLMIENLYNN